MQFLIHKKQKKNSIRKFLTKKKNLLRCQMMKLRRWQMQCKIDLMVSKMLLRKLLSKMKPKQRRIRKTNKRQTRESLRELTNLRMQHRIFQRLLNFFQENQASTKSSHSFQTSWIHSGLSSQDCFQHLTHF